MKRKLIIGTLLVVAGCSMLLAEMRSSISQYGITWTFDKQYECGQFVNGDWWVKGPVTVKSVLPGWDGQGNGSMVNPKPGGTQGFDARNSGKYNASLRTTFPVTLQADQSLISSIKKPDYSGSWSALKTAAILTCVSATKTNKTFRPHYCNTSKLYFTTDQINYNKIPIVAAPPILVPNGADIKRKMERPWIDYDGGWSGTIIHPADNMPAYGREISLDVSEVALYCLIDKPDRNDAIIRLIQLGIDNSGVIKSGGRWPADGGHASGRKWPILFAGIALEQAGMKGIGTAFGDNTFGEDCQTYYSGTSPKWGIRHCQDPNNPSYNDEGSGYRICCTSHTWVGQMLSALMMDAKSLWNHNAYFDYVDRWVADKESGPYTTHYGTRFSQVMWTYYRNNLPGSTGVTKDPFNAECGVRNAELKNTIYSITGKIMGTENQGQTGVFLVLTIKGWEKQVIIR